MSEAKKEEFQYEAEMSQLLHLIIHSLYSHKEIFLRELVSNSSDALSKMRVEELTNKDVLDAGAELKISITADEKEETVTIEDNGVGMSKDELMKNLGTIARSGTLEYVKKMKEGASQEDLIGQFGVGFYSVFMVCDEVQVETRSFAKDSKGYSWISKGSGSYFIEEIDKETRGTKIIIKLNDAGKEYKDKASLEALIKKYSDFVPFPIQVGEDTVNKSKAIWQLAEKDVSDEDRNEFYKYISHDFENPQGYIHLNIEGRVMFKSIMFIPAKAPYQLYQDREDNSMHLYVKRVFIQDDCKDLLPPYMRFVKGVVDTESLPLNVSREVTQNSPVMKKISDILVNNVLKKLEGWAEKEEEKYSSFYKEFSPIFKEGIHYDMERRDRLIGLMRFESSMLDKGQVTSFKDYISRMKEDQNDIYYIYGTDRASIMKDPNLEYCQKEGIEVILFTDPVDEILLPSVNEYEGKKITSVMKADFKLDEKEKVISENDLGEVDAKDLVEKIKEILGDKVAGVEISKRLVKSPVTLVPPKDGMDVHVEKMMKMMNKDFAGSKLIFEINASSQVIKNLSTKFKVQADSPIVETMVNHLYETALLMHGNLDTVGDYVERTFEIMEKAGNI